MKVKYGWSGTAFTAETPEEVELLRCLVECLKDSGVEFSDTDDTLPDFDPEGRLLFPGS